MFDIDGVLLRGKDSDRGPPKKLYNPLMGLNAQKIQKSLVFFLYETALDFQK